MTDASMYEAYGPFVALLRNGQFSAPVDGWGAELIGAHIARATDHMADLVLDVISGETPAFDNRDDVEQSELREYIDSRGGVNALADALDASARQLSAVASDLSDSQREVLIPVKLVDNGVVVVDQPIPLGALLQTHVNLHLSGHFEQLSALVSD